MKSVGLFFGIIISFFYIGNHIEANVIDVVPGTNDLNNKLFEMLLQRLERVELRNGEMERKMENMVAEFLEKETALNNRIAELEKLKMPDFRNKENENDVKHAPGERPDVNVDDVNVRGNRNAAQRQPRNIESDSRLKRAVETEVAFFATVTPHDVQNLGLTQNIVFDHADTNLGGAYHTTHGVFTAPVAGTYVFGASIVGRHSDSGSHEYYGHFDVNGQSVAKFISLYDTQGSQMVVLKLKAGDDVSVKNDRPNSHILGAKFTSFSGFLLYQDFGSSQNIVGK